MMLGGGKALPTSARQIGHEGTLKSHGPTQPRQKLWPHASVAGSATVRRHMLQLSASSRLSSGGSGGGGGWSASSPERSIRATAYRTVAEVGEGCENSLQHNNNRRELLTPTVEEAFVG